MGFVPNVIALKEAGTRPSAEGILVRFARIQPIKSLEDASRVAEQDPDLVLIDTRMPTLKSQHVAEAVRAHSSRSAILLLDFKQSPGSVRRQLNNLATLVAPHHGRALDIPRMARILNTSQEGLSRILNISARTAHRWMKGTRPRPKPELTRLSQVISLLLDTLPSEEAATRYLSHSNRSLNGETPLALFARGEFDRVEADIQAVREGVYV